MRSLCLLLVLLPALAHAQSTPAATSPLAGSRQVTYKTVDGVDLELSMYTPAGHQPDDRRPAAVFFFGGGWRAGSPQQFAPHCRYLASRGMVAMTADYRVRSRHGTLADRCVADAKSAIRWVRAHADRLGIDPQRILAAGGSAGGHLAACTAVLEDLDEPAEDAAISSVPNALALFNPALVLAPFDGVELDDTKLADLRTRTGVPPQQLSPIHHVDGDLPPTIIFHGEADTTVPLATVAAFQAAAAAQGARCELKSYPGAGHGFFNHGRGGTPGEYYRRTVAALDDFLVSLGYLSGEATINAPESPHAHLRGDLQNARLRFETTKQGSVAFLGGSITEMKGYRPLIMDYLQKRFPETAFTFTNAGISSTCSTTGAFRLARDVLSTQPDLLFVEFAVNDDQDAGHGPRECVRGMEGIVRHALQQNPQMDLIITHFLNPAMLEQLQAGKEPLSSRQHEKVAQHYGISSAYLAREVADQIAAGELTWETYGGTHPQLPGNRLAADLVIDLCTAAWATPRDPQAEATPHALPKPLDPSSYVRGRLLPLVAAELGEGWSIRRPDWQALPGGKRPRFTDRDLLCATEPGAELSLSFAGTAVGAYVLAGPDAGMLEYAIDGGQWETVDLYHRYSKGLHYPRTVMLATDLAAAQPHTLRLRVAAEQAAASQGTAARILAFVAN